MWEEKGFRHSLQPDFICPTMTCYHEMLSPIIKPLRKKTSPRSVYGLCYFCLRLIASILRTEAFSDGLPRGQRKWDDKCAACCLLSPCFIKLDFNAFSFLLIKLLGQWLMIVPLRETSREWRWRHEQKGWASIKDRESGLSHSAGWDFCCFPLRSLCCPWLLCLPSSLPAVPIPQGLQVDPGGRESHWGRISSCLSIPNLSPSLILPQFPSLPCIPPGTTNYFTSSQQSSLKELSFYIHYLYFHLYLLPPTSWVPSISAFLPPKSCFFVTQFISLLWGLI